MNQLRLFKEKFNFVLFALWLAVLLFAVSVVAQTPNSTEPPAIEWLKFQVPAAQHSRFIEQDAAIWTPVLSSYPGFQSKEIWTNPDRSDELVIVIHWARFADWQAIPKDILDRTAQKFHQAMETEYTPESIGFRLAWQSDIR
jgi:uncharacterized protein (TIGR03792 family)